jgi:hypothetical protein
MYPSFLFPHKIVDYRGERVKTSLEDILLLENSPASGSSTQAELTPQPGFHFRQSGLVSQLN